MSVPAKTLRKAPQHVNCKECELRSEVKNESGGTSRVSGRLLERDMGARPGECGAVRARPAPRPTCPDGAQRPVWSAAQVSGPTVPSAVSPRLVW
ncbi:hypothetical protein GCM10010433_30630 [Streptomyces pulveraceus]